MPPATVQGQDHANRPAVVVELLPNRVVMNITRTTQPPGRGDQYVLSGANPSLGLNKQGWWTDRKQRPVPLRWYGSQECRYAGRLPSGEAADVAHMWTVIKMLGR